MTGYDENMVVYFCERVTRHLLQVGTPVVIGELTNCRTTLGHRRVGPKNCRCSNQSSVSCT